MVSRATGNIAYLGALLLGHHVLFGTPEKWNLAYIVFLILACLGVFFSQFFLRDSPEDLLARNKVDEAKATLEYYQGAGKSSYESEADNKLAEKLDDGKYSLRQLIPVITVAIVLTICAQRMAGREFLQYSATIFQ